MMYLSHRKSLSGLYSKNVLSFTSKLHQDTIIRFQSLDYIHNRNGSCRSRPQTRNLSQITMLIRNMEEFGLLLLLLLIIIIIIITFSFIGTRNIPSVTNAGGIYKSNGIQYKLNNIHVLIEFAAQFKCPTIIADL